MSFINDKLGIYLITYNRINKLRSTLESVLSENSPIKDCEIIILDNNSTDGTSELIDEYCKRFSNISHIKHKINIGGNANICRAFEMSASGKKEYAWILCDDDKYDFSNWSEAEECMGKGTDVICVCDYLFSSEREKIQKPQQIMQMTFIPSIIYKTKIINSSVLTNMYNAIYTMLMQTCLIIHVVNNNGKIEVLSKPIVMNGLLEDNDKDDEDTYFRGYDSTEILKRKKDTIWILGYSNIISLLNDKLLQKECIETAFPHKYMYGSWQNVYKAIYKYYFNIGSLNYLYELLKVVKNKRRIEFILFVITYSIKNLIKWFFSIKNTTDKKYKEYTIIGFKFYKERKK